jgi:hypothetical protein
MKFQTSKTSVTPIQGYSNAYYSHNKYIPSSSVHDLEHDDEVNEEKDDEIHDNDDDDDDDEECNGRVLRYDTVTITSPVLASARLVHRPSSKHNRYVTDNDVNELNDKLQSLLLNTRNDEKEEEDDNNDDTKCKQYRGSKWQHNNMMTNRNVPQVELTQREQSTTTYFGRCSLVVYNSMTQNFVEVVRSARLAFTSPSSLACANSDDNNPRT